MSRQRYVQIMRFLGGLYALVGLIFFFLPSQVFSLINLGQQILGFGAALPDSTERFWLVLATAMMAMLSALSFLAASDPRIRGYSAVHVISKCVSVAGFIYVWLAHEHYFAYLAGVATDLPLALLVGWSVKNLRLEPASGAPGAPAGAGS